MLTYTEAAEMLSKRPRRKLANNTYLETRDNGYAVRLHETDIVTLTEGYAELNTGGWLTVTTKERLNRYAPVAIAQEKRRWYVYPPGSWDRSARIPYVDGLRVSYSGEVLNPPDTAEMDETAKVNEAELRRIRKFAKLCVETLREGMPVPSGGDCWYCAMRTQEDGKSLGDSFGDTEHLRSHMEEGYVVPSLLVNAVAEQGYPCPGIILGVHEDLKTMGGLYDHGGTRAMEDSVRRSVVKYLQRRLIPNEAGAKPLVAEVV